MSNDQTVTYVPGTWVCLTSEDTWLLADLPASHGVVGVCWRLMRERSSPELILGAILQAGFAVVSDFALASFDGDRTRLLLRGRARATWTVPGQADVDLSAEDAITWKEHSVPLDVMGTLRLLEADSPDADVELPVISGAVLASAVSIRALDDASAVTLIPLPNVTRTAPTPTPVRPAWTPPAPSLVQAPAAELDVLGPPPTAPPPVMSAAKVVDVGEPADMDEPAAVDDAPGVHGPAEADWPLDVPTLLTEEPASVDAPSPSDTQTETASTNGEAAPSETPVTEPAHASAEPAPASAEDALDAEETEGYDHLFGATFNPAALARADDDSTPPEAGPQVEPSRLADTWFPPADSEAPLERLAQPSDEPDAGSEGFIAQLPWSAAQPQSPVSSPPSTPPPVAAPPSAPPAGSAPTAFYDHDASTGDADEGNHTMSRASLLKASDETPAGPTVLAARCKDGHLSPAHAGVCRVCGQPLPPQSPLSIPRPVLGTLRFSNGDVVQLDRDVVIGRSPSVREQAGQPRPHAVKLPSPENDISRTHVEITLDGWHVFAEDQGSTNGTVVTLPGQPPQQLRPRDPQLIEPGTKVHLSDEQTFVYEVHA